jgi:hypothetical protein
VYKTFSSALQGNKLIIFIIRILASYLKSELSASETAGFRKAADAAMPFLK